MLSKNQFEVLDALRREPSASQRDVAASSGLSLGTVNSTLKSLQEEGLAEGGKPTPAGMEALAPYKVDNAVILAAGLSSRFAPISYEKPKGVLRVRGEVLIERQIEQLREAGITDITVVVGYKKEYFFYLRKKYGVTLVNNDEYASRNNNGSLWRVRGRLGNTYVCSSDDYFTQNPFNAYVFKAYYSAQYAEGPTKEWCMETGAGGRITKVTVGGSNSWYMLGHVYFDRAFSERFVKILEEEYDRPETVDMLWEDLYIEHIKELDMVLRPYPAGAINEFDSLDELRAFDPHFLENVDSEIFDNIVAVLGCTKAEIHDVYPLKQGLTNLSCHFATNDGEYVYRHPGIGTELLINRAGEVAAQKAAKQLGIDETFIHEDPERGWKISRFIPNCEQLDPSNPTDIEEATSLIKKLHGSDAKLALSFNFFQKSCDYAGLIEPSDLDAIPNFRQLESEFAHLYDLFSADGVGRTVLCHNDFFYLNLLKDEKGTLSLIDWEYSGMADFSQDLGTFIVCSELDEAAADKLISLYFDNQASIEQLQHCYAAVAFAGWCWYLWSLYKESQGESVGEWLYIYYRYAKKYLDKSLALYQAGIN